jgi:hypothetical protein
LKAFNPGINAALNHFFYFGVTIRRPFGARANLVEARPKSLAKERVGVD